MTGPQYAVQYYSVAQTAKCIRSALKAAFPAVKFSVKSKSYSGGASVHVHWTDGPTTTAVDAVVGVFHGAGFDGMIDLKYHVYAWVLNGEIIGTRTTGTEGSRGVVPSYGLIAPHDDAELVSFGADYINTDRAISPTLARKAALLVAAYYGVEAPAITDRGSYWTIENDRYIERANGCWSSLIYQAASDRARFVARES